jgi:ATP-dependent RNA helicase RhlE
MPFEGLGLIPELLRAIESQGYNNSTPIQEKAIPAILSGRDLFGKAQTGTGKTAAFALPILQLLNTNKSKDKVVRVLILVPTRELVSQLVEKIEKYGQNLDFKALAIFGGVAVEPQLKALKSGIDIVVATPGRLLDHIEQENIDLSNVEILVLDEADRMLDMGFIQAINEILESLPNQRQTLLFSATQSKAVKKFIAQVLDNPQVIQIKGQKKAADQVKQLVYFAPQNRKRDLLIHLIKEENWNQVLVFTRKKHTANILCRQLTEGNIAANVLHANKSQNARTRSLEEFKNGKIQVLVATDLAARGLDINDLPHVVNFELPDSPKAYVHRIGRTGRAGEKGIAVSLVSGEEKALLTKIEDFLEWNIKRQVIKDYPRLGTEKSRIQGKHGKKKYKRS